MGALKKRDMTPAKLGRWMGDFLKKHGITSEVGPPRSHDQHENEYVTLGMNGVRSTKCIGIPHRTASSESEAKSEYERSLLDFLGHKKHIIWRVEPEVSQSYSMDRHRREWVIYSRLTAYEARP